MTASSHLPPALTVSDDPETIQQLVGDLSSRDWVARHKARTLLASFGDDSVEPVAQLLGDAREQTRWEAAKTLSDVCSPAAAPALVKALTDEDSFGVRWVAAQGLIKLGRGGLEPLLVELMEHPRSVYLRVGAHHVLYELRRHGLADLVEPVLAALGSFSPRVELPFVAREALLALRRGRNQLAA